MALQHFDEKSFDAALAQPGLLVVDFWAEWCGPCRLLGPVIEQIAEKYDGKAVVGKVNVEDAENVQIAANLGVNAIPALFFYRNGQLVKQLVGFMTKDQLAAQLGL